MTMFVVRTLGWIALLIGAGVSDAEPLTNFGSCAVEPNKRQVCVDTTPCKTLPSGYTVCLKGVTPPRNAARVNASCWSYQTVYACEDSTSIDTCSTAPWMQKYGASCQQTNVSCQSTIPENGKCAAWTYTYACETEPAQKALVMQCTSTALGTDLSMATPQVAPNSPAKAVALLEAAREISAYSTCDAATALADPDACLNKKMFNGVYETCKKGYGGIKNCCKAIPGGKSNAQIATLAFSAGASVVKYAGAKAVDAASPYVFDALYAMSEYAGGMAASSGSMIAGTNLAASGLTLKAYGFTYGTGAFSAGSSLPGTMLLTEGGSGFVTFNPYVFAATVAFTIVLQELVSCDQSEQLLGMHKGQNLSVQVSEECRSKALGACVEWEEGWCSYNGVIGKVLGTQGRRQFGLSLDKSCEGISVKQMQQLDWSKLDLSELEGQVASQATKNIPNPSTVTTIYENKLNQTPVTGVNTDTAKGLGYPSHYTTP